MGINKVSLSGKVISTPELSSLSSSIKMTSFILEFLEVFSKKEGGVTYRKNLVTIEILGNKAERAKSEIQLNSYYVFDCYLRSFQKSPKLRLRSFSYSKDYSGEIVKYETLLETLKNIQNKSDLKEACESIKEKMAYLKEFTSGSSNTLREL